MYQFESDDPVVCATFGSTSTTYLLYVVKSDRTTFLYDSTSFLSKVILSKKCLGKV